MIYEKSLCWLRRDLRLTDNKALFSACEKSKQVFLSFIFDANILNKLHNKKDARVEFIFKALQSLNQSLKKQNSQILILHGDPIILIPHLCGQLNVSAVFVNEDYEIYAKKRDQTVKKNLIREKIDFHSLKDHVVFGSEIKKKDDSAYRVFTPYKKAWLNRIKPLEHLKEYPAQMKKISPYKNRKQKELQLKDFGFQKTGLNIPAGEKPAQKQLKQFSQFLKHYHINRDDPHLNKTSRLSVHLRFGTLSIRSCVRLALKKKNNKGSEVWLSELIWREFYSMILDQFPYVEKTAFLKKYQSLKWTYSKTKFKAWSEGQTGFPIVDAGMRQLNQTGFMPNRVRMICACFLVKDLLIDWRKGEKYFAEKLLDFDLASNNGGWQWCAGTGCDAQPYFRIFNPLTQSQKFDPKGAYIKSWLPELKKLNKQAVHFPMNHPDKLPKSFQLGKNYPFPIVNHQIQRQKALKFFFR